MRLPLAALPALLITVPAFAQSPADSAAECASGIDYAEGWYQGSPERMTRALQPALVNATGHGYTSKTPKDGVARITMAGWGDYLQLAKVDARWAIVNALWERKPGHAA